MSEELQGKRIEILQDRPMIPDWSSSYLSSGKKDPGRLVV